MEISGIIDGQSVHEQLLPILARVVLLWLWKWWDGVDRSMYHKASPACHPSLCHVPEPVVQVLLFFSLTPPPHSHDIFFCFQATSLLGSFRNDGANGTLPVLNPVELHQLQVQG